MADFAVETKIFKFTRDSVLKPLCPVGRTQAIYTDTEQPALKLRVTANGARSFIFEQRLAGKTIRVTIGPASMQIRAVKNKKGGLVVLGADAEAARLAALVAQGVDPRAERAERLDRQLKQREAVKAEKVKREVSALEAWNEYLEDRRPHWGERSYLDHLNSVAPGGLPRKRSTKLVTQPGPLHQLLDAPLVSIDAASIEEWIKREASIRPARVALAFRHLRAFLNWCSEHSTYRNIVDTDAHRSRRAREKLPRVNAKSDSLERGMLKAWFAEVRRQSPAMSAFLQVVLLTGCRPGEALEMRWEDIDFRWHRIELRDKVEGRRMIALTPYVEQLLRELRRVNSIQPPLPRRLRDDTQAVVDHDRWEPSTWVFVTRVRTGERMSDPKSALNRVLKAAALPHVTPHGLRRSFGSLSEWVECPVGIVAQIQGHKPSATAEKHYRVRPLDLLRMWHTKIETWILHEAGIEVPNHKLGLSIAGADAA